MIYSFLRIGEVSHLTGLSKSAIYALRDPVSDSYDPNFPKPVVLSPRCVRWRSDELQAWMDGKCNQREIGSAERKAQAAKAGKASAASRTKLVSSSELAGQG